jgi:hypothetical protein
MGTPVSRRSAHGITVVNLDAQDAITLSGVLKAHFPENTIDLNIKRPELNTFPPAPE